MSDHIQNKRITALERKVKHLERVRDLVRQKIDAPTPDEHHAHQEYDHGKPVTRSGTQITPTRRKEDKSDEDWHAALKRRIVIAAKFIFQWRALEGVGIIAVIGYTALTYLQWSDLRRNFETDERSWARVIHGEDQALTDTKELSSSLTLINSGKTPARQITVNCVMNILRASDPITFTFNNYHQLTLAPIVFPGNDKIENVLCGLLDANEKTVQITQPQREGLASGDLYMISYGTIDYRDQFGWHWSHFCWWRQFATPGAHKFDAFPCTAFNDTDSRASSKPELKN